MTIPAPARISGEHSQDKPVCEGVTLLLSDAHGQYAGSRLIGSDELQAKWQPAVEIAERAAIEAQAAGYFGPLGIDAAWCHTDDGPSVLRALQDINARHTMGRLALGWRRFLKPGESASWRRVNWSNGPSPQAWFETVEKQMPAGVRIIQTTPFEIDDTPTARGMVLLIGDDTTGIDAAESVMAGG